MTPGQRRAVWVGGLTGVGALLVGGIAWASGKGGGGGGGTTWRNATDADVARDKTEPVYAKLLSQSVGYSTTGVFNGNTWRFVVCSGAACDPPSSFQKDVRGFIASA
jgi:hypothetical protein